MITAQDLLGMLREVKFLEAAVGWILSNYAESWPWYQRLTSNQRRIGMVLLCVLIGSISTIAYYFAYGGDVPLVDSLANLLYAAGVSFVGSTLNYTRLKAAEAKAS